MARARGIKPSIMDNEVLAELPPLTRLTFIYLWMLADREGRLEDRPARIAAQALAYDRTAKIDQILDSLACAGFLIRYQIDGLAVIQITNFTKHQRPHQNEVSSELPPYDDSTCNLGNKSLQPRKQVLRSSSLTPSSLTTDSLFCPDGPFDRFWQQYPKREGKAKAMEAFAKLPDPTDTVELILRALLWQSASDQWTRDNRQYVPLPATYLNQRRWLDEPIAPVRAVPKPGSSAAYMQSLQERIDKECDDGRLQLAR